VIDVSVGFLVMVGGAFRAGILPPFLPLGCVALIIGGIIVVVASESDRPTLQSRNNKRVYYGIY